MRVFRLVKVLGEPTFWAIARELVVAVRNNVTIDWTLARERAGAKACALVVKLRSMAAGEEPHVSQWQHQELLLPGLRLAMGVSIRLLHHSTVVSVQGKRYRLKDKRHAGLLKAPAAARAAAAPV